MEGRVADLAAVETRDNGSLLRSHLRSVMPRVARNFRFFADRLLELEGSADAVYDGNAERVSWDPAGVTAVVSPWNAPLMLATWRIAPALAAGNTVVQKPPEWAPLTASLLADVVRDAGVPDGVFNVVQGIGEEAGAALVADPDVDRVAFTGSVDTGRLVARAAAGNLTPASLELGGKSPFLIFADADPDAALRQAIGQFDNAGQVCLAGTRLLVEVVDLRRVPRTIPRGRRRRSDREIRVRDDDRHRAADLAGAFRTRRGVRAACLADRCDARLVGGGPNDELGGLYYRPTLFTDMAPGSEILTKEVFGPVLTVQPFADEDEAIALANATDFGLAATVYTGDPERARRVSERLVAGTVWVNCFFVRDLNAPFGGARDSGVGREGGVWSFDFYADVKNVCIAP